MTRGLTAGMQTELSAKRIRPVLFVEIDFSGGTVYFWSGLGDFDWDGETWNGAGDFLSLQPAIESLELSGRGIIITLSGVNPAILSIILAQIEQGRKARCWLGFLDAAEDLVVDPYQIFEGYVDTGDIDFDQDSLVVTLRVESKLIRLQRERISRFTDQDQQTKFPGDKGFQFVNGIQQWEGSWGRYTTNSGTARAYSYLAHHRPPSSSQGDR